MTDFEKISVFLSSVGFLATLINIIFTSRVKLAISDLKLWSLDKFITKDDHYAILKAGLQFERLDREKDT